MKSAERLASQRLQPIWCVSNVHEEAEAWKTEPADSATPAQAARRVLMLVENLSVPFDRRVWSEATTLHAAGYVVSVICPRGPFASAKYEHLDGVHIYRHPAPLEAAGKLGYLVEYASALFWQFLYSIKVFRRHGFDLVHACNPPDLMFLIGAFYKYVFGKKFVFDQHDLNPELYEAKFGRRGLMWNVLRQFERLTFRVADISIAPNESYRRIAIERGGMAPDRVFTVRSGPNLDRVRPMPADAKWKNGRAHLVAYVGVIGEQEGLDLLVEAMTHIVSVQRRADVQAVVMGSGPAWSAVKAMAASAGLGDFMTFTGRVDDPTLFTVLSTADVCVSPDRPNSLNDKSTMNKIMEYMAMGKPIVQFDLTEGRVSAREASLYARGADSRDFADKILQLVDASEERRQMGAFGLARVRSELCWSQEAPKLIEAYRAAFAGVPRTEGSELQASRGLVAEAPKPEGAGR